MEVFLCNVSWFKGGEEGVLCLLVLDGIFIVGVGSLKLC